MSEQVYGLTLSAAPPIRRGSTPLPVKHLLRREEAVSEDYDWMPGLDEPVAPPSSSIDNQDTPLLLKVPEQKYHGPLRIVLLGQNGVGKSSLALSLAGLSDRSLSIDSETQTTDEGYQRRVTVDDEDSSILVYDNWKQDLSALQCEVCILVFSVTDRRSFHRVAQLRLLLREGQPNTPLILVGNKSDLVRSREISTEEAHHCAMMFGCMYLELSVSLEHGTNELLEAAVRAARGYGLGPGWAEQAPIRARRESITTRARRFLSGLVPRSHHGRERLHDQERHRGRCMSRQKSRSCHDLSALM
ncbi:GTP-binding protein REM 2 [Trichomycterus rosablanca]|uniref:GTP-binding protein REM 2 n=1 Tax=Trichomycterus rosablanca TaxID=2290929 RepID=UPI002F359D5E